MSFFLNIEKDIKNNTLWYVGLFLLPLVFFFSELSDMSFTQDELRRHSSFSVDPQWLSQGRFGMYLISWLYSSNPVFPYVGIFLSSVVSIISVRMFFESVCHKYDAPLLISGLFISCPFIYYLYAFSTVSFSVGVIYCLTMLSVYFIFLNGKFWIFLATLFLCFAISIYQSAITVFILMFLIAVFYRCERGEPYFYYVLRSLVVTVLALLSYIIAQKIVGLYFPGNQSGYINSFINLEFSMSYLLSLFGAFISRAYDFLSANETVLPQENIFQLIGIYTFSLLLVVYSSFKKTVLIPLFLCILATPFLLEVLSLESLPARSYIALPLLFTFVFYWLFTSVTQNVLMKVFIVLLTILYIVVNFININKFTFYDHNAWKTDQRFAGEMINQVLALDGLDHIIQQHKGKIPLHSVGYLPNKNKLAFNKEFENIGKGFFSWGDNELQNSSNLFNSLGWDIFSYAYPDNVIDHINTVRMLPSWPMPGSVAIVGDFVVIKLSDYTENQVNKVCSEEENDKITSCLVSYNPRSVEFEISGSMNTFDQANKEYMFGPDFVSTIRHSTVKQTNNTYIISSSVSDSFLVLPPLSYDGQLVLRISIEYESPQSLALYFKQNKKSGYSEDRIIRLKPIAGKKTLYITLPAELFEQGLRVDFSNSSEEFKLYNLEVYRGNQ